MAAATWLASIGRMGRTLAIVLAVATSLLTFPSGVVVMVACWLVAYTVAVLRVRRGEWLLAAPVAVLLVKRVDWPVGLWVFMAVAVVGIAASRRLSLTSKRRLLLPACVWIAWLAFAADSYRAVHASRNMQPAADRPIVCIGDSLTSYTRRGGYPEVLADMVTVPVVNLGQSGITSTEALKKLPDLIAARPQAVVIELGGHDFLKDDTLLKRASRATAMKNLETIIEAARQAGAAVILIEVPRGFIVDPFAGLERELARRHDLELVPDTPIRQFVLSSPVAPPGMWLGGPYLSDDGLHPNHRGNVLLAQRVLAALTHLFGERILRPPAVPAANLPGSHSQCTAPGAPPRGTT